MFEAEGSIKYVQQVGNMGIKEQRHDGSFRNNQNKVIKHRVLLGIEKIEEGRQSRRNGMSLFRICFRPLPPALDVTGALALYICCLLWRTRSTVQAERYDRLPNRVLAPISLPKRP